VTVTVDDRGRILLPKEIRDAHGLVPGRPVLVESGAGGVVIRAAVPMQEALRRLTGILHGRRGSARLDIGELKRMWEPKL
jgi:AbrB family looped-hinge helix DNA binding protein